jgi:hypothetical protein
MARRLAKEDEDEVEVEGVAKRHQPADLFRLLGSREGTM